MTIQNIGEGASPVFRILGPSGAAPSGTLQSLQNTLTPGSTWQGTVVDVLPDNRVILQIGDQVVMAQTEIDLPKGARAEFLVKATQPQIVLKMVGGSEVEVWQKDALKEFLRLRNDTGSILNRVTEFLSTAGPETIGANEKNALAALWDKILLGETPSASFFKLIGVDWEAKIKGYFASNNEAADFMEFDLKGVLSRILGTMPEEGSPGGLNRELSALLTLVEGYQATNSVLQANERHQIVLPVWFSGNTGWGECDIVIDEEGDGGSKTGSRSSKSLTIAILLRMSRLGTLCIDVRSLDKVMTCRFTATENRTRDYISAFLPELKERLVSSGFSIQSMECVCRKKEEIQDGA
ncbi:MAG: flagellar hook-length control protein FliK, partial [Pseudomonadota bacterium]